MKTYEDYHRHLQKIADIHNAASVLNWDQETYMPPKGARFRAQQQSTLAGLSHEFATSQAFGDLLKRLSEDSSLTDEQQRNVKVSLRNFTKNEKFDTAFVQKLTTSIARSFQAWRAARENNDFTQFAPALEELVALKREQADIAGYGSHPYDALLDDFEPGATTAQVDTLFDDVRQKLVGFVKDITDSEAPNDSFLRKHYDKDAQWEFGLHILKEIGYDFEGGRQDVSAHPFTTNFSSEDVRVTTRVNEHDFSEMTWSCIHEGGHALYEQGLLADNYGLPAGKYLSLGIHESQSRLWENNVGRSLRFWKAHYADLQKRFPENLGDVNVEQFYHAINKVAPSLIRIKADELTYHFHVMIRFEVEKALMEGTIEVNDLPNFWNAKYKEYLGVDVSSNNDGVLQDIHWSHGSFGYFPTYSLGSFYAVQFYDQAVKDIDGLEDRIEAGDSSELLSWLRENIHRHGQLYSANELCTRVTGKELDFQHFMDYANAKYSVIYGLKGAPQEVGQ